MTTPSKDRRTAPALALLVSTSLLFTAAASQEPTLRPESEEAWALELAVPAPVDGGQLEGWDELSCAGCHETIAEEWSRTMHAMAWTDEIYHAALKDKRRPESCHGCHIPVPLHSMPAARFGRKPPARGADGERRELGITCRTCHEGPEREILGPFGAETDAHRSVQSEHFTTAIGTNALCIACHGTTIGPVIGLGRDFRQARLEERGMSCVGCHMQPVERPIATDDDDRPTATRKGRSHLLQTPRDPAFLAQAFAFGFRTDGDATLVTIANRAGHRVPGLIDRKLVFRFQVVDDAGNVLAQAEHRIDSTAYLPIEGSVDVRIDAKGDAVRVVGNHHMPGRDEPIVFLDRTIEP